MVPGDIPFIWIGHVPLEINEVLFKPNLLFDGRSRWAWKKNIYPLEIYFFNGKPVSTASTDNIPQGSQMRRNLEVRRNPKWIDCWRYVYRLCRCTMKIHPFHWEQLTRSNSLNRYWNGLACNLVYRTVQINVESNYHNLISESNISIKQIER